MNSKAAKAQAIRQVRSYRKAEGELSQKKKLALAKAEMVFKPMYEESHWKIDPPEWVYIGALVINKMSGNPCLVVDVVRKLQDKDLTRRHYRVVEQAINSAWSISVLIDNTIHTVSLLHLTSID
jgi:hypothetical protein